MKPPFDIAADLDTPVSAYLKLAPFRPRFLLESVEGGERLARYSFIGFGDCLEVRLDASGLHVGDVHSPRPNSKAEFLNALRAALDAGAAAQAGDSRRAAVGRAGRLHRVRRRALLRTIAGAQPRGHADAARALRRAVLASGIRSSDAQRRAPARRLGGRAAKLAPRGHAGAARCGPGVHIAGSSGAARFSPATPSLSEAAHAAGVRRAQEYIASGDVYQLVLASRFEGRHALAPFEVYRALRLLNPSPYMFFCELGDHHRGGLLARSPGQVPRR